MKKARLSAPMGRLIERNSPLDFTFEGETISGFYGDTIASAVMASGRKVLSRSFKYHRPRGILSMAGEDANTLVQLPDEPNVLADIRKVTNGLKVRGQNYKGSLDHDRDQRIEMFSRFMPVGFYYRAFYKPAGMWKRWEPLIRRKAGLGVLNLQATPGYYDKAYLFCDLMVVGAGPAGIQAALTAADNGARVIIAEQQPIIGGSLTWSRFSTDADQSEQVLHSLSRRIDEHPRIRLLKNATCNGWFTDHYLPVIQGQRMYKVRAGSVVVAAGAYDQPVIFRNNDLPGVMLTSAALRLMSHYGVKPGQRAVLLTGNDDAYFAALTLAEQGVEVAAIVDMRAEVAESAVVSRVRSAGTEIITNATVYEAYKDRISGAVSGAEVRVITGEGSVAEAGKNIDCDLLCMSAGYMPAWQLPCQAGGKLSYDDATASFSLSGLPGGMFTAGSINGWHSLGEVLRDGVTAGHRALQQLGFTQAQAGLPAAAGGEKPQINYPWPIFPHPKGKEFVDFDEDLQIRDIVNATRHGYRDVQLVKRFSTVGMGPSQGRHSALPTARLVAKSTRRSVSETGITTARPPLNAESLSHLAGRHFDPWRVTPMHQRHLALQAQMMPAGNWLRPGWYRTETLRDKASAVQAEALNVRNNVGMIDVTTLGGIELRGPDAAEFLNRMYTFAFIKQPVGRTRYALLTNEQGVVIDDGVACRLGEQHFYVTATTSGVARVYQSMLQWNIRWRLDVDITNVTSALAAVNLAGPNSRQVLEKICTDIDLSAAAFPYLACREGHVAGIPARLLRVGFVGELGYEIHVPSRYGQALWDALAEAGKELNIRPFGVEAQRLLRLEKGHVIIGQDTDGMSHPAEINMGWAVNRNKPEFIGRRAIDILESQTPVRKLVAFSLPAGSPQPLEGHLVVEGDRITGNITSCEYSPTLNAIIGMSYASADKASAGERITIRTEGGKEVSARVVKVPFYDAENQRQEL
ncbi:MULTISPECIES: 2Fe-2S iron-sulfur cluster-binding protein [unclassified Tatumella]|uniref:2Fe-2S iron-sulfur cluster-binding protein n=1 Tax=unclassified Tatumella TaxID=2649542 RepID=UPI001BB0728E|nr:MULTISPECIES: 2Fe-2S iron-sulfur cluster-binding protein [unclassified Tatumella]MBS0855523.1 (2Fe-2S)-binding protein [Tatumella sp. JGM16]MBS0877095.1 (2Fe-2S)-binding protein [Tatumella sp. JGM82]MBS0890637.1 (2Fe-2S)-binding protein [Tatumella sp. JGM94]MBS0901398.1 (2Fe-2S)-binding protein [Tatumella sp. JGM100]MBS0912300.1 (2Fe-2S)-binding protein [Tatumella sp. JGM91]